MDPATPSVTMHDLLAHADWVRALARHLVADPHGADDVEQETWVAGLRRPPARAGNLRAWLARVVRRRAEDRRRAATRRSRHEARAPVALAGEGPEEMLARAELRAEVAKAVLELAEPYRSAVLLRYFEDLDVHQIAALQRAPVATIRTRIGRAIAILRERLGATDVPRRRERFRALAALGTSGTGAWLMSTKAKAAVVLVGLLLAGGATWWALGRADRSPAQDAGGGLALAPDETERQEPRLAGRPEGSVETRPVEEPASAPDAEGLVAYPALSRAAARLEGVVRDARGGWAGGATVEARSSSGAEFARLRIRDDRRHALTVEADAEGRFVLTNLLEGPYLVRARLGDAASGWRPVVARPLPAGIEIALQDRSPEDALAVRVVDVDGAPVAGVSVEGAIVGDGRAPLEPGALRVPLSGITDAEGRITWPRPRPAGGFALARAPDGRLGARFFPGRDWIEYRETTEWEIVLAEGSTIEGRVASVDGKPVEGVVVRARLAIHDRPYWSYVSKTWQAPVADGRYSLTGLPAGTYVLVASGGGWNTSVEWQQEDRYPVTPSVQVAPGGHASLDLKVERGDAIEGRVTSPSGPVALAKVRVVRDPQSTNEPDGVDLAGTNVWRLDYAYQDLSDHPLTHWEVDTGRDGRYRVEGLRPGTYRVEVSAPGLTYVQRIDQELSAGRTLVVDAVLVPAGVLQGAMPGGSYLGVRRPGAETCEAVAILPPTGLFTFPGLPAGDHELVLVYWGWETTVVARATVVAGRTTWVDLWNHGAHGAEGRLLLGGEPFAAAAVGRGWGEDAVRTDAQGRFRLRWARPGGDSDLRVSRPLAGGGTQSWQFKGLPLSRAGETDLGDLELGRERTVVEVVDPEGRGLEAALNVTGGEEGEPRGPRVSVRILTRTGPDGRVALDGLPAGRRLRVEARLTPSLAVKDLVVFPVSGPVRLVAPRTSTVTVMVRTAAGAPAAKAYLWLRAWTDRSEVPSDPFQSEWPSKPDVYDYSARADEDGRAVLPSVPAGAVFLRATEDRGGFSLDTPKMATTNLLLVAGERHETELTLR